MIECTVYFEPYYHVLKALQNMNQENLPMKQYIVDVQNCIVPPNYVQAGTIIQIDMRHDVPLLQPAAWPSADQLQLDATQLSAFHAAFTQKFVIIQGPPGTGKTFLGLKIAKNLINNKHLLQVSTPILVVCFTNHALDQFLEGLIETTVDIVRVGGQSKNEALDKFKLKNKKRRHNVISSSTIALRDQLRHTLQSIKRYQSILEELSSYNSIVNFKEFFFDLDELADSWFVKASSQQMLEWLFGGRTPNARVEEQMKIRLEEVNINLDSFCNKCA